MKRNVSILKTLLLMMLMSWVLHGHALSPITNTDLIPQTQTADVRASIYDMTSALVETLTEHAHNHQTKDHWHESLFIPDQADFQSLELIDKQRDRSLYFIPEAPVFPHDKPPRDVSA